MFSGPSRLHLVKILFGKPVFTVIILIFCFLICPKLKKYRYNYIYICTMKSSWYKNPDRLYFINYMYTTARDKEQFNLYIVIQRTQ